MTEKTTATPGRHAKPFHRYAMAALEAIGLVLGLALLVHVSWNMFAPDLLGLTPMRMQRALGLVVFTGTMATLLRLGGTGRRIAGRKA